MLYIVVLFFNVRKQFGNVPKPVLGPLYQLSPAHQSNKEICSSVNV